jgi:hypothetical protein
MSGRMDARVRGNVLKIAASSRSSVVILICKRKRERGELHNPTSCRTIVQSLKDGETGFSEASKKVGDPLTEYGRGLRRDD